MTIRYVNVSKYDDSFVVVEVDLCLFVALYRIVFPVDYLFAVELPPCA